MKCKAPDSYSVNRWESEPAVVEENIRVRDQRVSFIAFLVILHVKKGEQNSSCAKKKVLFIFIHYKEQ